MNDLDLFLSREGTPPRDQEPPKFARIYSNYFANRQELPVLTPEHEYIIDQKAEKEKQMWRARNFPGRENIDGDDFFDTLSQGKKRKSRRHRTKKEGRTRTKKEKPRRKSMRRKSARRKSTSKHRK